MINSAKVDGGNVRRAGPADAAILAAIHAASFAKAWDAAEMAVFLASPDCLSLLACGPQANLPQGFLIARRIGEEAELLTLAVLPIYRGRGRGRALLGACVAALKEAGGRRLFFEVDENNARARRLYASFGAVPVGRRPGYYEHGGDAAIFCLAL